MTTQESTLTLSAVAMREGLRDFDRREKSSVELTVQSMWKLVAIVHNHPTLGTEWRNRASAVLEDVEDAIYQIREGANE